METGISAGIQDGQAREHQRLPGLLMDDLKLYSSTEKQHGVKLARPQANRHGLQRD